MLKLERSVETGETGEGRKFLKYQVSPVPKIRINDGSSLIIMSKLEYKHLLHTALLQKSHPSLKL